MNPIHPQLNKGNDEIWYDPDFDRELIVQSIAKQYHILPSDQGELHYSDWYQLLAGIMEDTPLGRVVLIRKEKDPNTIKQYGKYEKQIRSEWRAFRAEKIIKSATNESRKTIAEYFEKMFAEMLGS